MTKTSKIALSMLVAGAMAVVGAQAVPVTGTVNFTGGAVTLDAAPPAATTIESFSGTTVVSGGTTAPSGAYTGTTGDTVTWAAGPIQFSPTLNPSPVSPLWTFHDATTGYTYSFSLSSITLNNQLAGYLNLGGAGTVTITGAGSPYTATSGTFTLTATGTGPLNFNFTAGTSAVPESGTTAILLGLGVTALAIFAKFRKPAIA
jgi:hypothetical protein